MSDSLLSMCEGFIMDRSQLIRSLCQY